MSTAASPSPIGPKNLVTPLPRSLDPALAAPFPATLPDNLILALFMAFFPTAPPSFMVFPPLLT